MRVKEKRQSLSRVKRFWLEWRAVVVFLLVMFPVRSSVADWYHVPSGSMKPTIIEGDRVFVNKLAYDLKVPFTTYRLAEWDNPKRGDVVTCLSPVNGIRLVKRVVAVPGDTVEMRDNQLRINRKQAEYKELDGRWSVNMEPEQLRDSVFKEETVESLSHPIMITPNRPAPRSFTPVVVPKGQYLLLGDNRDNSADSRYFGFAPRGNILGKATCVIASLNPNLLYLPRWGRFMEPLHCEKQPTTNN